MILDSAADVLEVYLPVILTGVCMRKRKCVVVGGGIVGSLTALALSDAGHDVVLLEKFQLFSGATPAALGALTPYSDHEALPETQELARESVALYPDLVARIASETGVHVSVLNTGTLELAFTPEQANNQKRLVDLQSSDGQARNILLLSASEARRIQKCISPDALSAIHYVDEKTVDTSALLRGLNDLLAKSNCVVVEQISVSKVGQNADGTAIVYTSRGTLDADEVIVCPGWGYQEIRGLPPIGITQVMGEVVQVAAPPGMVTACIYSGDGFIAPRSDGRLMLGSNYEIKQYGVDESEDTIRVGSAIRTLTSTMRLVPQLSECQITRLWKSWRPKTPDAQPVIGRVPGTAVILAAGFYGLGITLAPIVANLVRRSVEDRAFENPQITTSPSRFEVKKANPDFC